MISHMIASRRLAQAVVLICELVFLATALSEDCIASAGQEDEVFGQGDDFSRHLPRAGKRR